MKRHMMRWGAVYILILVFLGSWVGQFVAQAAEFANDARSHGEKPLMAEFWPEFWAATFENWQSEFLQLAFQAILVAGPLQLLLFRADVTADKEDVQMLSDKLDRLLGETDTPTETGTEET